MDSSDLLNENANPILSIDKESKKEKSSIYEENSKEESVIVPSTKRTQFLATYCQQRFPFRASIMRYLAENPISPEFYQKMIKTCKFFFVQNPIIVVSDLKYNGTEWKKISNLHWEPFADLEKIMAKFWITKIFHISAQQDDDQNMVSTVIPKFFRMDATVLSIKNQVISFDDFVYFTSTAEGVFLKNVTVKDENGTDLSLEKLVEIASKAKTFKCTSDTVLLNITSDTFNELLKLPNFLQLDSFVLNHVPESFDIEAFYTHMKKNMRTFFFLEFHASISAVFKNRLEEIIDEIIAAKNRDYFPPLIQFLGLDNRKSTQLIRLYRISRNALMEEEQ